MFNLQSWHKNSLITNADCLPPDEAGVHVLAFNDPKISIWGFLTTTNQIVLDFTNILKWIIVDHWWLHKRDWHEVVRSKAGADFFPAYTLDPSSISVTGVRWLNKVTDLSSMWADIFQPRSLTGHMSEPLPRWIIYTISLFFSSKSLWGRR